MLNATSHRQLSLALFSVKKIKKYVKFHRTRLFGRAELFHCLETKDLLERADFEYFT
jgi:hypothetical protein